MSPLIVRWQLNWISLLFHRSIELNLDRFWTVCWSLASSTFLRNFHLCPKLVHAWSRAFICPYVYRHLNPLDNGFFPYKYWSFSIALASRFQSTFPNHSLLRVLPLIRRKGIFVSLNLNAVDEGRLGCLHLPLLAHFYFGAWFVRVGRLRPWVSCFKQLVAFWNIDFFYCIVINWPAFFRLSLKVWVHLLSACSKYMTFLLYTIEPWLFWTKAILVY